MPHQYHWLIDRRVLFSRFEGAMDADEILTASRDAITHLKSGIPDETVHSIIDARYVTSYPIWNFKMLSSRESGEFRNVKNVGWILLVTKNKVIISLSNMIKGVSRVRFRTFDRMDTALSFLREQTPELDWQSVEIEWQEA